MHRLSSNATLLLKIFLPTFWAIFFGALTLAFIFTDYQGPAYIKTLAFKLGVVGFYLLGLLAFYLTFWRLRRVEFDDHFVYITDYFKTARYPFHNIEVLKSMVYPFFNLGVLRLREKGIFGKKIYFIHKKEAFERIILNSQELLAKTVVED